MKKYMPLNGLRWSRDSGSTLCDTPQNGRSRTGWGRVLLHNSETKNSVQGTTTKIVPPVRYYIIKV